MNHQQTVGLKYLGALVTTNDTQNFVQFKSTLSSCFFEGPETDALRFIEDHFVHHAKFPAPETVEQQTGVVLVEQVEPASYYAELLRKRFVTQGLKYLASTTAKGLAEGTVPDPEALLQEASTVIADLKLVQSRIEVKDLRDAMSVVYPIYKAKSLQTDDVQNILLGWPKIDDLEDEPWVYSYDGDDPTTLELKRSILSTGKGFGAGDLVSFVGRPGQGKSQMMLCSALNVWKYQKKTPLFISMEMTVEKIMQRLVAIMAGTAHTQLVSGTLPTNVPGDPFKKFFGTLTTLTNSELPFYVIDGNLTARVDEVADLVAHLRPDVVYIDGAYLLNPLDRKLDRYQKVAATADFLKQVVAGNMRVPTVASWQFNRAATKLPKGTTVGLEHIGNTDVIGQLSSVVMSLTADGDVDNRLTRLVNILKGRDGQEGEFRIHWDWDRMRFGQVRETSDW